MAIVTELGDHQCQASNVSDAVRCIAQATANNDLFCRFHAKQCYGLYLGYKRRNARLDAQKVPSFLRQTKISLASQTFRGVTEEETLSELHRYLFEQFILLSRVIDARRLHHKHFYSPEMDYGHQSYLDKLVDRRRNVATALQNLERRTAEMLYRKEKWFDWVRTAQDDEEEHREKEKEKIKLEAALWRRHWKDMQTRINEDREKERKRRQDAYLEEIWKDQLVSQDESGNEESWDPIEDVVDADRAKYIDLIKHFLWIEVSEEPGTDGRKGQAGIGTTSILPDVGSGGASVVAIGSSDTIKSDAESQTLISTSNGNSKKKSKGKKKKASIVEPSAQGPDAVSIKSVLAKTPTSEAQRELGQGRMEGKMIFAEDYAKELNEITLESVALNSSALFQILMKHFIEQHQSQNRRLINLSRK